MDGIVNLCLAGVRESMVSYKNTIRMRQKSYLVAESD